jgi:hypothetical protein
MTLETPHTHEGSLSLSLDSLKEILIDVFSSSNALAYKAFLQPVRVNRSL